MGKRFVAGLVRPCSFVVFAIVAVLAAAAWAQSATHGAHAPLAIDQSRASGGGFTVAIDSANGAVTQFCNLLPGTPGWQCTSDRNAKENFMPVDSMDVLARVVAMPISTWNFKGADPSLRAIGPTAQDFYAAFRLGNDDKSIATSNLAGVALAAIQGLYQTMRRKDDQIAAQGQAIARLTGEVAAMRGELDRVTRMLARNGTLR